MKTTLQTGITAADICDGFVYNQLEGKGLYGMSGKLTIQPEYQRNYIYADGGDGSSDDYGGVYDKSTIGKNVRLVVTIEYGIDAK